MPYEFHGDKKYYFDMTLKVTQGHILPMIEKTVKVESGMDVLEIGCGEAGVLKAFADKGCNCFGIELEENRLEYAKQFVKEEFESGKIRFLNKDIYLVDIASEIGNQFDIIILKDVIEHIPNQEKFVPQLHKFLKPGGLVFYAFPPWHMPFGGHQQVLPGKWAKKTPYFHILPNFFYRTWLKLYRMPDSSIATMMEIKSTGISIQRFLKIQQKSEFTIIDKKYYLFNPIYEYKFGIRPRLQNRLVASIPRLRDFFTMGVYFIVKSTK